MHLYKTKHDFIHNFLHKSRVVVGRGGFEARMSSTALCFKGIQRHAPQALQVNFYSFFYPPTNRTIKQIDKVFNITPTIVTTPQSIYHNLFKNDLLNSAIHFSYLQSFRINILFYYNPSTLTHKEPTGVR
jgi:hypothetical protein